MCKDFREVIFWVKYTHSHRVKWKKVCEQRAYQYCTHKTLMVMIWLRMKVLFTCLDLCVIYNGSCLFHFTYSHAGRVTWIRVVLHTLTAHLQRMAKTLNQPQPSSRMIYAQNCSCFVFFFFFFVLCTLFSVEWTVSMFCLHWTANKLLWCWILDEEVMFYARIDS